MTILAAAVAGPEPDLIARREGAAGVIRLNRPKTINALTLEMTREIVVVLDAFEADPEVALILLEGAGERGLCAGGDIRGLYESARAGGDLGKIFWREEYILNARIAAFPKPYVVFMDGIVMGGGVGLSAHGSHRVATDRTKIGMPEVGVGFFPDVGGTWLLSRAPGEIGTYFGLTGQTMNGADAVYAGFADVVVASDKLPALREALTHALGKADARDVRAIIDGFAVIKKIEFASNAVILRPVSSDPQYKPIILRRDFQIFGKVIDVIRVKPKAEMEIVPLYTNPPENNEEERMEWQPI